MQHPDETHATPRWNIYLKCMTHTELHAMEWRNFFGQHSTANGQPSREPQMMQANAAPSPFTNYRRLSFSMWSQHMHGPPRTACTPMLSEWLHTLPCAALRCMHPTPWRRVVACAPMRCPRTKDGCRSHRIATARRTFFHGRRTQRVGPFGQTDALNQSLSFMNKREEKTSQLESG
jgi:hypothetical protein